MPVKNEGEKVLFCLIFFPLYPIYFNRLSINCPRVESAMPITVTGK